MKKNRGCFGVGGWAMLALAGMDLGACAVPATRPDADSVGGTANGTSSPLGGTTGNAVTAGSGAGACSFTCPSQGECICLKDARGCDAHVMRCTPAALNACGTAQVVLCPGNVGVCDFAGACDPLRSDCQDFCPPPEPSDAGVAVLDAAPDADPAGCPAYCPSNCTCLQDRAGCNRVGKCDGPPCGPRIVLCAESYVCDFDAGCDLQTSDCREFCSV